MRRRRQLTCAQVVELLSDYLDGELAPADRELVQEHLRACGDCARYADQLGESIGLTRVISAEPLVAGRPRVTGLEALLAELRRRGVQGSG